jgi:hypothetical protein
MNYKVLTIMSPWATLLVHGIKKIETRPKPTSWTIEKGSYLIHAAKKWNKEQFEICHTPPFIQELLEIDESFKMNSKHPNGIFFPNRGHIIGAVDIVECCTIHKDDEDDIFIMKKDQSAGMYLQEPELSFGDYREGRYAWITDNPRILETPIPYKGQQGYYAPFKGDVEQLKFKQL